ncbi:DJ-1/PfpI family protein [Flavilitoribacter nigricans]|uniref:Glutamine amidotransferase n=1 Tax=Flavilitoribacter nigricans (strain ATCC 23147 / DSM 23189 / NBRC 102662 / NCIMB 1420 / SS-2) TaxID=1122177 RepID=A0A2D0MXN3_FLAN2|nr:DJ-1/PfpI family protein [Flavilitoribacter nigricans]PHN00898.1 glutamine amidotransferase [Flavilitoribacter nigricans DSM 23189 = NBRC 102662]
MKKYSISILCLLTVFFACQPGAQPEENDTSGTVQHASIDPDLPTVGLLMYDGVLTTEVTAALDVFTKPTATGEKLFNVLTIAETPAAIISEEGLKMVPDISFADCPELDVLFVPSAYDMSAQVKNQRLVEFIRTQNQHTRYTVSNCAGAHLIGEAGIANGKKIVTWIGGGAELQAAYPELKVQNDSLVTYVEDGKFLSSNGNLASYISSLELLEKLTDRKHREFVTSYLYLDRLQAWRK